MKPFGPQSSRYRGGRIRPIAIQDNIASAIGALRTEARVVGARIENAVTQLATGATALDASWVVRRVLAGDREAFRVLVEREGPGVVRACDRILGNRDDAEDAAQEAFVIAYRSLNTWRGDGPFGAWLARIAVRIALRHATRRRTVSWVHPQVASVSRTGVDESIDVGSGGGDPAVAAARMERSASVRRAVSNLAEPYREIVALRFFAERSLLEIAHETGRPLGTVKTQLHRGLIRLRAELEPGELEP